MSQGQDIGLRPNIILASAEQNITARVTHCRVCVISCIQFGKATRIDHVAEYSDPRIP